jgi:dipeptidyl aminopeptidase/acylaminoacyl peptidase
VFELPQDGWQSVADFSPDGKLLAVASFFGDGTVRIWDLASRREVAQVTPGNRARFSPDGRLLAAGAGGTVRLWDVATWQQVATLRRRTDAVRSLAFAPDSRTLAVGESEGTLRLWDVVRKQELVSRKTHASHIESVTFSPDGRRLASSGTDSMVKLWDVSLLQEVVGLTGHEGPVNSLAFSPDGNTLASASADATVRLWRAPPLDVGLREPTEAPSPTPLETIHQPTFQRFGTAQATITSEGDAHRIDVAAVDGTNWHVQLYEVIDDLQEGATYAVRFRAKADAPSSLGLDATIAEVDYHNIGLNEAVPLSEDWRTYQYQFQAKELAARNQINFEVGERTGTVWIANFTLTKAAK